MKAREIFSGKTSGSLKIMTERRRGFFFSSGWLRKVCDDHEKQRCREKTMNSFPRKQLCMWRKFTRTTPSR